MIAYEVQQNQTAQPLLFLLVSSSDHITGVTGATPTVTLSKSGGAFAAPAGAVSEIGNGWYKVAGNATDANTLGPLALHATAAGADPTDTLFPVVSYNPQDATRLGLAALPNATASAAGGLLTYGTAAGQLNPSAGGVDLQTIKAQAVTCAAGVTVGAYVGNGTAALAVDASGRVDLGKWLGAAPLALSAQQVQAVVPSSTVVASVTGAVGSVTGSVGSVTGGVGGSVAGSVASVVGNVGGSVASVVGNVGGSVASVAGAVGSVTAAVTVGGYATGQDPATLVLDVPTAGHNAANTIGAKINAAGGAGSDPLANPVPGSYAAGTAGAALGRIGTGTVSTVSPVSQAGDVALTAGDSYAAADGRALVWTGAAADAWPDLTGAAVTFDVGGGLLVVAGTVVTPTGTQQVRAEPAAADTAKLKPVSGSTAVLPYDVRAVLASGRVVTLVRGRCAVTASEYA